MPRKKPDHSRSAPRQHPQQEGATHAEATEAASNFSSLFAKPGLFSFLDASNQLKIVVLLAILFYANTFFNQYALDDDVVIVRNTHVQNGFAGIPDLLDKDSFHGYLGKDTDFLPGGRYRPISLITFAIEQDIFGGIPFFGHLFNVLLYGFTAWLMLLLYRKYWIPGSADIAFLATILFVIHPLHTEVVANIKSRDEILSLVFLLGMLICLFKAVNQPEGKGILALAASLILYFLALMSKENGVTAVAFIPLALYFFSRLTKLKILLVSFPYLIVVLVYLAIRTAVIGDSLEAAYEDDMTNPYLQATFAEKYATILFVQLKYIGLLLYPHPLSWDYSYPQIEYRNWTSPETILAVVVLGGLFVWSVMNLARKHVASFGLLFYFISMALVANVVINIGAPMGERFAYQGSMGFLLAAAALFVFAYNRLKSIEESKRRVLFLSFLGLIIALAAYKTINRNNLWYDSIRVAMNDVKVCPRSAKTNMSAGDASMALAFRADGLEEKMGYFRQATPYFYKTLELTPEWGNARVRIGESLYEEAKIADSLVTSGRLDEFSKLYPNRMGLSPDQISMVLLDSSLKFNPDRHNGWSNLGHMYKTRGNIDSALACYNRAVYINPDTAVYWYQIGETWFTQKQYDSTIVYFNEAVKLNPKNPDYLYDLGVAYYNSSQYNQAQMVFERALTIDPKHERSMAGLQAAQKQLK